MTPAELLPFHLCLRLGYIHPDHLFDDLTPGQWRDWLQVDQQTDITIHREDLLWAECRADFLNANRAENSMSYSPANLMHHFDTDLLWEDDISVEGMIGGVLTTIGAMQKATSGAAALASS